MQLTKSDTLLTILVSKVLYVGNCKLSKYDKLSYFEEMGDNSWFGRNYNTRFRYSLPIFSK